MNEKEFLDNFITGYVEQQYSDFKVECELDVCGNNIKNITLKTDKVTKELQDAVWSAMRLFDNEKNKLKEIQR